MDRREELVGPVDQEDRAPHVDALDLEFFQALVLKLVANGALEKPANTDSACDHLLHGFGVTEFHNDMTFLDPDAPEHAVREGSAKRPLLGLDVVQFWQQIGRDDRRFR